MTAVQAVWGWMPALYLFLGGLSGGTALVAAIVRLSGRVAGEGPFSVMTSWASAGAIVVGLVLLVADLDNPEAALAMWDSFSNPSSWMTWGSWLLAICTVEFGACAAMSTPRLAAALGEMWRPLRLHVPAIRRVLLVAGIPLGAAVALYTGVLLSAARFVVLWHPVFVPFLFTLSAVSSGAAVAAIALVAERRIGRRRIGRSPCGVHGAEAVVSALCPVLTSIEAAVLAVFVGTMKGGSPLESVAMGRLLEGDAALVFWAGCVGAGIAGSLVCDVLSRAVARCPEARDAVRCIGSACMLIGSLALRYAVLGSGVHAALAALGE